jgi:uncharacterized protein (TIGR02452 family)
MKSAMLIVMDRSPAMVIGYDTVAILRSGGYTVPSGRHIDLRTALDLCQKGTVEYPPGRDVSLPAPGSHDTTIRVENETVLVVGQRMARSGPVAALNFASATTPGGGFLNGARAQEESIARSSGLFVALQGREMYAYHRRHRDPMHSDYVMYSPEVPVFRTDAGDLLDEPWPLSIVTCPAVNGSELSRLAPERLPQVPALMAARTAKVLSVAAEQGVRRFILGAWGCGAFGLNPGLIARIFRDALKGPFRGVFDEVVFAVIDKSDEERFIGPFKRAFAETERPLDL